MNYNKKQRATVKSVWREVSTQSSSNEGGKNQTEKQCIEARRDEKLEVLDSGISEFSRSGVRGLREGGGLTHIATVKVGNVCSADKAKVHSVSVEKHDVHLKAPEFTGKSDADAFIEWLDKYSTSKACSVLSFYFRMVENAERAEGEVYPYMNYGEVAFGKLQSLKMGISSLDDYTDQYYLFEARARLHETEQQRGSRGSTQKQIEEETGVKLIFPPSKMESFIVIEGTSIETLTKASEKIQVIVEEAVKSPTFDYSHFISLPLAIHPELVDRLMNFQNSILGTCNSTKDEKLGVGSDGDTSEEEEDKDQQVDGGLDVAVKLNVEDENEHVQVEMNKISFVSYPPKASESSTLSDMGIDRSIFIKPKTFHLTVLMLKLWDKERIRLATEVLQSQSSKVIDILGNSPVSVKLKGLECMRGSLAKARVLYVPIEVIGGEDRLLCACQVITDAYIEAGLVLEKDAQQKLKLHGTVMNARHRKRTKKAKKFDSFDARGIVKQFGSEEWGGYLIREAHLSQRFAFEENGYYHCCTSIPFPENEKAE
ncbi:hypothetical protein GIB67_025303 [Kingdonia uniflora]|uniref:Uncharacterized protein n=1 Tax=Kingdonia uniflora TaxID=39325 RepID=A0A7J7NBF9_9MAGN|nr:hypothetical protein GIB67_025303 [Kingdonia uniflora]